MSKWWVCMCVCVCVCVCVCWGRGGEMYLFLVFFQWKAGTPHIMFQIAVRCCRVGFIVIDAKHSKNISGSCKRSRNISVIYETKRFPWYLRTSTDGFSKCSCKHLLQHLQCSYLAAFCSINMLWKSLDGAFSHKTS